MPEHRARKHHQDRVAETLRDEIGVMIEGELSDPRIDFCYVSEVALNPGGKSARVYVAIDSAVKDIAKAEAETIAGLEAAKGYIRHELKERMGVRHVPELTFLADRSGRFQARIDELMSRASRKTAALREAAEARLRQRKQAMRNRAPGRETTPQQKHVQSAVWNCRIALFRKNPESMRRLLRLRQAHAAACPRPMPSPQSSMYCHRGERFLVCSHARPDGDAVGSMLALGMVLEQMGKAADLVTGGPDSAPLPEFRAPMPFAPCCASVAVTTRRFSRVRRLERTRLRGLEEFSRSISITTLPAGSSRT